MFMQISFRKQSALTLLLRVNHNLGIEHPNDSLCTYDVRHISLKQGY